MSKQEKYRHNSTFKVKSDSRFRRSSLKTKKSALSKPMKISPKNKMSSKGMKGRPVSAEQKRYHDALASLGCIACRKMGYSTPHISIHHIDGRTKPNAHWLVLPLCGPHHQDAGIAGIHAVHPHKARFEAAYGKQADLLVECIKFLFSQGYLAPVEALVAASINTKENPALFEQ